MSTIEHLFIVSGIGGISTKIVNQLLDDQVAVALFNRNFKAPTLFLNIGDLFNVILVI